MTMVAIRAVISDNNIVKTKFLLPGEIVSLVTSMLSLPVIAIFFWQRLLQARHTSFTAASCTLLLVRRQHLVRRGGEREGGGGGGDEDMMHTFMAAG
jgi:hypothetical protein